MEDLLAAMSTAAGVDEGIARVVQAERSAAVAAAAVTAAAKGSVEAEERERAELVEAAACCALWRGAAGELPSEAQLEDSSLVLRSRRSVRAGRGGAGALTSSTVEALQHQSIIWLASKFEALLAHHLGGTKWWTHFEQWLWSRRHACAAERAAAAVAVREQHLARLTHHDAAEARREAERAARREEEGFSSSEEEEEDDEDEDAGGKGDAARAAAASVAVVDDAPLPPTTAPVRGGGLLGGDTVIPEGEAVFFDEELSRKLMASGQSTKGAAGLCEEMGRLATRATRTLRRRIGDAAGRRRGVVVERVWVGGGADVEEDDGTVSIAHAEAGRRGGSVAAVAPALAATAPTAAAVPTGGSRREKLQASSAGCVVECNLEHHAKLKQLFRAHHRRAAALAATPPLPVDESAMDAAVFCTLARYSSAQGAHHRSGGHQAAIHGAVFTTLEAALGEPSVECFASPLNCYYPRFCSAFPDTDAAFGSLGSFFEFSPTRGSFEANPPFEPAIVASMLERMNALLARANRNDEPLQFIIVLPLWRGKPHWDAIEASPYCQSVLELPQNEHGYTEGAQHLRKDRYRVSSSDSSVMFLQSRAATRCWSVSPSLIRALRDAFRPRHQSAHNAEQQRLHHGSVQRTAEEIAASYFITPAHGAALPEIVKLDEAWACAQLGLLPSATGDSAALALLRSRVQTEIAMPDDHAAALRPARVLCALAKLDAFAAAPGSSDGDEETLSLFSALVAQVIASWNTLSRRELSGTAWALTSTLAPVVARGDVAALSAYGAALGFSRKRLGIVAALSQRATALWSKLEADDVARLDSCLRLCRACAAAMPKARAAIKGVRSGLAELTRRVSTSVEVVNDGSEAQRNVLEALLLTAIEKLPAVDDVRYKEGEFALPAEGARVLIVGDARRSVTHSLRQSHPTWVFSSWCRFCAGETKGQGWPDHPPRDDAAMLDSFTVGPAPCYDACIMLLPLGTEAFRFALHAVGSMLSPAAPLIVGGVAWRYLTSSRIVFDRDQLFSFKGTLLTNSVSGHAVVGALRRAPPPPVERLKKGKSAKKGRPIVPLEAWGHMRRLCLVDDHASTQEWLCYPGLFARGGLDVMTRLLIRAVGAPPPRARVLDYCSGSGVIAAAMRLRTPSIEVHLLDADAVAIEAAKKNLVIPADAAATDGAFGGSSSSISSSAAEAVLHLSDGWSALGRDERFDLIVSNPPVHNGERTDLRVLRELITHAPSHLTEGGSLYIVAQESIPVGAMLSAARADDGAKYCGIELIPEATQRGRFHVWRASVAGAEVVEAEEETETAATASGGVVKKKLSKRARKKQKKKANDAKRARTTT